jgi:hypothetical protein
VTQNLADLTTARPIIVHSHLRWDFVWQRPQQLFSRFARTREVLFVEEPIFLDDASRPALELTTPLARITRAIPRLPASYRESETVIHTAVRTLLLEALATGGALSGRFEQPIQWFYTPMPAPTMIGAFDESAVVYDCMDELAQFRFAPNDIVQRERFLLARADVVFAGGARLAEAKSRFHDNVHFFGCGVDAEHFGKARDESTPVAPELLDLPHPVLGYIGVIDERLDYALIAHLADAMPEASVVMVGPVVKVDPRELPRLPNIHWLGQRNYEQLPTYIRGFDVCLMPFALNKATEFINPTKTLEYMATGKPIVSTPVADVVRNFTPIVAVADGTQAYVNAVRSALAQPDETMRQRGIDRTQRSSWENITNSMTMLMEEAILVRDRRDRAGSPRRVTTTLAERGARRSP